MKDLLYDTLNKYSNMNNFFTVNNQDLEKLQPDKAVEFFRRLLYVEATSLGIPISSIDVSSAINTPDGGIDAEVKNAGIKEGQGLIKKGLTAYQIKTGSYNLTQENKIKDILFNKRKEEVVNEQGQKETVTVFEIKDRVKYCLDNNGTLIIVLFGWDSPSKNDEIVKKFREILSGDDQKYTNAKIEIFKQNNVISFIDRYPTLAAELKGTNNYNFQIHKSWAKNDDMSKALIQSSDYDEKIKFLQKELFSNDKAKHIRILGEPGIGKTRFIFEATRNKDIEPLVAYFDSPVNFKNTLLNELCKEDLNYNIIPIIDECDKREQDEIWKKLKNRGSRVKIITIYYEDEYKYSDIDYIETPILDSNKIKEIINSYGPHLEPVDKYIDLAGNSPRFAHMIGQNLREFPDDILRPIENIYDRIIAGSADPNSPENKMKRLILRYLSLFIRFGWTDEKNIPTNEYEAILNMLKKADPQITKTKFQEIIKDFQKRKILQGKYTLYITPKAFQIQMWKEWWDTYGEPFKYDEFIKVISISNDLKEWFYRMFVYACESEICLSLTEKLLNASGPFHEDEELRERLKPSFFLALTTANPKAGLKYLKRTLGKLNKEELLNFRIGRRESVFALEYIAQWKEYFDDAAELLLSLAEAENENNISNNATGAFVGLFSPGISELAPTEVSLGDRIDILKKAFSESSKRREIALKAFESALRPLSHCVRAISSEQPIKPSPKLWTPTTWDELFDSYKLYWNYLVKNLDRFDDKFKLKIIEVLLNASIRIINVSMDINELILDSFKLLYSKSYISKERLYHIILNFLHYQSDKFPENLVEKWKEFETELKGSSFSDLLNRYVGMDLLADHFPSKGKQSEEMINEEINKLVLKVISEPALIDSEYYWLMTSKAKRGSKFGYFLGQSDKSCSLLETLIKKQIEIGEKGSAFVLGGYFNYLHEQNKKEWQKQLDLLSDTQGELMSELVWRTELTDYFAKKILLMIKKGSLDEKNLGNFVIGGGIRGLSESVFLRWIRYLLKQKTTEKIILSLNLLEVYYNRKKDILKVPLKIVEKLLLNKIFWKNPDNIKFDTMIIHYWTLLADLLIEQYPENSEKLTLKLIEYFGAQNSIIDRYQDGPQMILNKILKIPSNIVWETVSKYIGPPIDSRAFRIRDWLRGTRWYSLENDDYFVHGALDTIAPDKIWKWVDEDQENRAKDLASFIPSGFYNSVEKKCLFKEFLVKYGADSKVRTILFSNFISMGTKGSQSKIYKRLQEDFLRFKEKETNKNIKIWLDESSEKLESLSNEALREEERR